jgi:ActR/RegA family two-component response regulator
MTSGTIRSVLLIEDQAIVACDLQRFLDGTGYRVVGPVGSLDGALSEIANNKLDGAVLDVKLSGDRVPQIAEALKAAKVPHIFVNGWAVGPIPEQCRDRPLLNNPYDYRSLLDALNGAMAGRPNP